MIINTEKTKCSVCENYSISKISSIVVDETSHGVALCCTGVCPVCRRSYEWYEEYAYLGFHNLEAKRISTRKN